MQRFNTLPYPEEVYIYLDDVRLTPEMFERTYTVEETIELLEECAAKGIEVAALSLDNDLGEGLSEGYKVADWLEEKVFLKEIPAPDLLIAHTSNPEARRKMCMAFESITRHR